MGDREAGVVPPGHAVLVLPRAYSGHRSPATQLWMTENGLLAAPLPDVAWRPVAVSAAGAGPQSHALVSVDPVRDGDIDRAAERPDALWFLPWHRIRGARMRRSSSRVLLRLEDGSTLWVMAARGNQLILGPDGIRWHSGTPFGGYHLLAERLRSLGVEGELRPPVPATVRGGLVALYAALLAVVALLLVLYGRG